MSKETKEPAGPLGSLGLATGSALYDRFIRHDRDELMHKVWDGTPWIVSAYTGGPMHTRWREIMDWCDEQFGPEAWPIHGHAGNWHTGGATVDGETWMGFATEEMMNRFLAAWPNK